MLIRRLCCTPNAHEIDELLHTSPIYTHSQRDRKTPPAEKNKAIPKLPIFAPNTVLRQDKTDYSKKEKQGHFIPFQDRLDYYDHKTNSKENINKELIKVLEKLRTLKILNSKTTKVQAVMS